MIAPDDSEDDEDDESDIDLEVFHLEGDYVKGNNSESSFEDTREYSYSYSYFYYFYFRSCIQVILIKTIVK
jgi:hypothetical protein